MQTQNKENADVRFINTKLKSESELGSESDTELMARLESNSDTE